MPSKTYNKAIINGTTYIDLSADTVVQNKVLDGYTFHDKNGVILEGTCHDIFDHRDHSGNCTAHHQPRCAVASK